MSYNKNGNWEDDDSYIGPAGYPINNVVYPSPPVLNPTYPAPTIQYTDAQIAEINAFVQAASKNSQVIKVNNPTGLYPSEVVVKKMSAEEEAEIKKIPPLTPGELRREADYLGRIASTVLRLQEELTEAKRSRDNYWAELTKLRDEGYRLRNEIVDLKSKPNAELDATKAALAAANKRLEGLRGPEPEAAHDRMQLLEVDPDPVVVPVKKKGTRK